MARSRRKNEHAVSQSDCFTDIMGYKQDRLVGRRPDGLKLSMQSITGQGIQRPEWLIHEQHRRVNCQRPRDSDPLAHSAGELMDITLFKAVQMHSLNETSSNRSPLPGWDTSLTQAEFNIVLDIQPGKERRFLEEQHPISAWTAHFLSIGPDCPTTRGFQSCN